jgi:hypothetical protein
MGACEECAQKKRALTYCAPFTGGELESLLKNERVEKPVRRTTHQASPGSTPMPPMPPQALPFFTPETGLRLLLPSRHLLSRPLRTRLSSTSRRTIVSNFTLPEPGVSPHPSCIIVARPFQPTISLANIRCVSPNPSCMLNKGILKIQWKRVKFSGALLPSIQTSTVTGAEISEHGHLKYRGFKSKRKP